MPSAVRPEGKVRGETRAQVEPQFEGLGASVFHSTGESVTFSTETVCV